MKRPKNQPKSDREIYLNNRNNMLEDFYSAIEEVQKPSPSVQGKIAGLNFQDFNKINIFTLIKEQENYIQDIKKYKMPYTSLEEEETILKDMVKEATKVFGDVYEDLYKSHKR